jgi:hypothetical protein
MKIVINTCFGGFGLGDTAMNELRQRKGNPDLRHREIARDDPDLVEIVERMGETADGPFAELKVVEIPDDVKWQVEEYDGREWVAEQHRTWR